MNNSIPAAEMVRLWMSAYQRGLTLDELAAELSRNLDTIRTRVQKLKGRGVNLPELKKRPSLVKRIDVEELNDLIRTLERDGDASEASPAPEAAQGDSQTRTAPPSGDSAD